MAAKNDPVLYSPDACHALERDAAGHFLFRFAYAEGPQTGQEVSASDLNGARRSAHNAPLRTNGGSGLRLRVVGPRYFWPAVIDAVNGDGTADLSVTHPFGGVILVYGGVRHSATKEAHTWHTAGE